MSNEIRLNSSPNNNPTPWDDLELESLFEGNSHLDGRIYELGVDSLNSSPYAEEANSSFPDIPVSPLNSAEALPISPSLALPLSLNMSAHLDSTETLPTTGTKRKRCEDTEEISDKSWSSVSENEVDEDQYSEILLERAARAQSRLLKPRSPELSDDLWQGTYHPIPERRISSVSRGVLQISTTEPSTFISQSTDSITTPITAPSEQLSKPDYKKCKEKATEYMNQNPTCPIRSIRAHIKETMGHDISENTLHRWRRWVQEPQKLSEIDYEKCREKTMEYINQNPTCPIHSVRAHIKETMGHDVSETSLRTWIRSAQQPQQPSKIDYKKCREKTMEYMNQNPTCPIRSVRAHIKETMGHDIGETSLRIWRRSVQKPQQSSKIDYDQCKEKAAEYINQNPGCNMASVQAHINETMNHDVDETSLPIWRRSVPKPPGRAKYTKCKEEFEKYMNQNPGCNMESVQAHLKETVGHAPTQQTLYKWEVELQGPSPRERGTIDYKKCKEEFEKYMNQNPGGNTESVETHIKKTLGYAPAKRTLYLWASENLRECDKIDYNKCKEEAKQYVNQNPGCTMKSVQAHIKETLGYAPAESTLQKWASENFRKDGRNQSL